MLVEAQKTSGQRIKGADSIAFKGMYRKGDKRQC